jgi:hypothetical protein
VLEGKTYDTSLSEVIATKIFDKFDPYIDGMTLFVETLYRTAAGGLFHPWGGVQDERRYRTPHVPQDRRQRRVVEKNSRPIRDNEEELTIFKARELLDAGLSDRKSSLYCRRVQSGEWVKWHRS